MKLFKRCVPLSVAFAMLVPYGVYAQTTVNPFVDDVNNKLKISGSFDNIKKDWVTVLVYEGKYTQEEINAMSDDELKAKLRYFTQAEFANGEYSFDFEFDQPVGWYTLMISSFEDAKPDVRSIYYYKATDMVNVTGDYNAKIKKPSENYVPSADGTLAVALVEFLKQYENSCFSDIKYFYDLPYAAQKDVARSQIGMEELSLLSQIKARVEEKSILRMMSDHLLNNNYNAADSVSFILNNAKNLQIEETAEYKTFKESDSSFMQRVTERMKGTQMDDVPLSFRENVILTQIERVSNVDNVTAILASAEKSLKLDLSIYNDFDDKSEVNAEIAGKSIESIDKLLDDISDIIDDLEKDKNKNKGGSGGGSGGGGGGWSKPVSNIGVSYPADANTSDGAGKKDDFTDFNDAHWAYTAVNYLKSYGIVSGYSDGSFKPENNITRAEFVKMIVSALGLETGAYNASFTDVSESDWFSPYVALAEHYNIVYGDEKGEFRPNENITRQDAAVIAYRGAMFLGTALSGVDSGEEFVDAASIADYASNQVNILKSNGILSGDGGYFNPDAFATRAQMSQMIYSLLMRI